MQPSALTLGVSADSLHSSLLSLTAAAAAIKLLNDALRLPAFPEFVFPGRGETRRAEKRRVRECGGLRERAGCEATLLQLHSLEEPNVF